MTPTAMSQTPTDIPADREVTITRWVAIVAGLLGFVMAVLTPLLPVVQTTATLNWPQGGRLDNVTSPLISLSPVSMTATVPCEVIRAMPPKGGMVLGLAPQKAKDAALNSLFVTVSTQRVDITDRNVVIASVPRSQVTAPDCQRIEVTSTDEGTFAEFIGVPPDPEALKDQDEDSPQAGYDYLRGGFADPNLRPNIVGVFTDLTGPAPPGLSVSAVIDTRFTTKPTALKLTAMLLAIAATVVALAALWRLDRLDGRRMHRLIPRRWRTFTPVDLTVVSAFLVWHVMGANSSDDGYILGMARVADHAGYMSNYFRWFGSPEDPFGWYYNLLALMTHVSDASIWIRLPDLACALICWLLLSREVLPRLGPAVSGSRAALWAAG
ncbi:MAG: arabinosyltransferase domain-containing protein, partial [Mycobacterium sp.]|nr:arabinosyltransferase domain-containing protein [Mycobacterium sp.]